MTTTVIDPIIEPASDEQAYDKLHYERLVFGQKRVDGYMPTIAIDLVCWRYGYNLAGEKAFYPKPARGSTRDFNGIAFEEALARGLTTEQAIAEYLAAKAEVNAAHALNPYTTFELMAYFELCLGMLAEKLDISTLEKIE